MLAEVVASRLIHVELPRLFVPVFLFCQCIGCAAVMGKRLVHARSPVKRYRR
ncbi:hypothetical protein ACS15_5644 [Ralstonia insidiosa]|uniref:Uncharacterized protein n=1 Tax=Ralstonia insidiosa TaxID=190721 RepID=A0AAC9FV37_9RALS|nr:hypothetical protein ACS15_5644 [Ralstonia insidiosa]